MQPEFQVLFDKLPIGAVVLTPEQEIRYANDSFAQFVGYSREKLAEMSILDITEEFDREKLRRGTEALYAGEEKYLEMETAYVRKDGERVWGYPVRMLHPNPSPDERDTVLMLVVDITERRQMENKLRRTERMNALGLLAGSVAHEFNNVLTIIKTFLGLLKASPGDEDLVTENIDRIDDACDRGQALTRQLLEFGRAEALGTEEIELNEFLRNIEEMFARLMPSKLEFRLALSEDNPTVITGRHRLHQVIMNLVLNARDAMEGEGVLTIETAQMNSGDPGFPETRQLNNGEYTRLRVCDTGPGIPEDDIPRIFEPFFTTKEQGTGMGLTTVYGIVQEDKGYMQVEDSDDGGACIEIYLPATKKTRKTQETEQEDVGPFRPTPRR